MKMNTRSVSLVCSPFLATALCLSLAACSSGNSNPYAALQAQQAKNAGNFSNTVFLGDSLTAGFQSGSLLDTLQVHGWAPLVATQANFNIVQPLIAYPGAPNVLQLDSVGPPPVITTVPGTTTGRDNFATQVTDLAVPGALTNDVMNTVPLVNPALGQQQLNQLVLGFPGLGYGVANSQLGWAIKAQPTTIFLWIGNNDALVADETGMPSSMTSVANFTTQYTALITQITHDDSGAPGDWKYSGRNEGAVPDTCGAGAWGVFGSDGIADRGAERVAGNRAGGLCESDGAGGDSADSGRERSRGRSRIRACSLPLRW